jgi:NADH-quinone oxidoreductase subunit N
MDFLALWPGVIIAVAAILVLLEIAIKRDHFAAFSLTIVGLFAAFVSLSATAAVSPRQVTMLFIVDRYAIYFMGLIFIAAFVVAALAFNYLRLRNEHREDFYVVLLIAVLGSIVLVTSNHFIALFLGLETLTISLYVMIAYLRTYERSLEAGIKYLILAAASSAFLLLGMAFIYAELGTMQFEEIASAMATNPDIRGAFFLVGTGLIIVGFGFKLALVPFHMWTPDVYEGAPAPVTAFVATVSKSAMFALLLRFFLDAGQYRHGPIMLVISVISIASMFAGNLLALLQKNVKRILAYSSIAHLGYLLVALLAGGQLAFEAVLYYFVVYFIAILGSFGLISLISGGDGEKAALRDYRGLFWTRPWLAGVLSAMLFSLAGIPLTAGFVGKFYLLLAGIHSALWALVIILVVNSAIGLYYYLRIIVVMFSQPVEGTLEEPQISFGGSLLLAALTVSLIYLGVYPTPLLKFIHSMISGMV